MSFRNGTTGAKSLIDLERKRLNESYDSKTRASRDEDSSDYMTEKQKRAAAFIKRIKKETGEHQKLLKDMEKRAEERLEKLRGLNESEQQKMDRIREEERKKRILEHISHRLLLLSFVVNAD